MGVYRCCEIQRWAPSVLVYEFLMRCYLFTQRQRGRGTRKSMTVPMPIQEDIRELAELGWSQREIAKRLGISRDSVAKYSAQQDFSPKPPVPVKRPGGSVVAAFEPIIEQ